MYNVLIRPLSEEDADTSYRWRNDPAIWEYTGNRPDIEISKNIERAWIRKAIKESNSCRFAIMADGIYVGNIQITNINERKEGQYHIFIGEKTYWGKGVATLATYQIIRFVKEVLDLKQLYLLVNPDNKPAIKVYEKCGFIKVSDEIKMVYDLSYDLNPMVSVFMMTYNHGPYIQQAIESILEQKTDFDFDIVLGDDCSTDNTRSVIENIFANYPGKFKLLLHKKNMGAADNQMAVLSACTGKYIAMCEGDDYWTDPLKLQKQADFLESNPDYGMICTNFSRFSQSSGILKRNSFSSAKHGHEVKFEDYLLDMSSIGTATVVMRSDLVRKYLAEIPEDIRNSFVVGDTPLWLFAAARSKVAVLPDETAVYRILDSSACHFKSPDEHYKFVLRGFEMADYFYGRYGEGNDLLQNRLKQKKLRAALFHGYRSMNRTLASESFKELMSWRLSFKRKISARLMLSGSYNKLMNRMTGIILRRGNQGLNRT